MGMFDDITYSDDMVENTKDVLGGGGYLVDSGVYKFEVDNLYFTEAKSGAIAINLIAKVDGKTVTCTEYITSGNKNGKKNFYVKDGKNYPLPGFTWANDLCMVLFDKPVTEMQKTVKTINVEIYNDVQPVEAITKAIGKEAVGAFVKQLVNKYKDGKYIAESKEENRIVKFFYPKTGKTVNEHKAKAKAQFYLDWDKKYKGTVPDKRTIKTDAVAGAPKAAQAAMEDDDDEDESFFK